MAADIFGVGDGLNVTGKSISPKTVLSNTDGHFA
jgi:hypothetical protein